MRRPWNMINIPVYSLATYDNGNVNMNICTYVTPISLKPKQYIVGLYHNTKTLENLKSGSIAILQILNKEHLSLVNLLGKKSGYKISKEKILDNKNLITDWNKHKVLIGCNAYLLMENIASYESNGDHDIYHFNVKSFKTIREENILMLQDLIDDNIIL